MKDQIQKRIDKLDDVGEHAFNGTDYSFGFSTWRSGTVALLRKIVPNDTDIIDQILNIKLVRVDGDRTDSLAYNLVACKNEAREILEILVETYDDSVSNNSNEDFWGDLHPIIIRLAKDRFEGGFYADAVSACLRELNSIVKDIVRQSINQELDGAALMTRAFSANNPIISFADTSTENGRNIQLGYMKIFEGAMIGIRNPKAHTNQYPDENKAIHFLYLTSFLFIKLQDAGVIGDA